jgi:hypothetical protein
VLQYGICHISIKEEGSEVEIVVDDKDQVDQVLATDQIDRCIKPLVTNAVITARCHFALMDASLSIAVAVLSHKMVNQEMVVFEIEHK